MYDERGADGKRAYTVRQIADTFGVGRATIYRYLDDDTPASPTAPAAGRRPQRQTGPKAQSPALSPASPLAPSTANTAARAEPEPEAGVGAGATGRSGSGPSRPSVRGPSSGPGSSRSRRSARAT
jgi:hypothetical protein